MMVVGLFLWLVTVRLEEVAKFLACVKTVVFLDQPSFITTLFKIINIIDHLFVFSLIDEGFTTLTDVVILSSFSRQHLNEVLDVLDSGLFVTMTSIVKREEHLVVCGAVRQVHVSLRLLVVLITACHYAAQD